MRKTMICHARHEETEWTDAAIRGLCRHSGGGCRIDWERMDKADCRQKRCLAKLIVIIHNSDLPQLVETEKKFWFIDNEKAKDYHVISMKRVSETGFKFWMREGVYSFPKL